MFDETIRSLRQWFEQKRDEKYFRSISIAGSSAPSFAPIDESPSLVLKEDTHVELGHPSAGSCSLCAATTNASLVSDATLTIFGPDIPASENKILPFAQLIIASCDGDVGEVSLAMDRAVHAGAQMKGYMLRSVPNRVWARVSREAAASGFSLETLGRRLYRSVLAQCSGVTGVQIFLVTSTKADVSALERLVGPARGTLEKIQTYARLPDGSYECTTGLDCTECPEKTVCDNIREVITIRKGDKIITFDRSKDRLTEPS